MVMNSSKKKTAVFLLTAILLFCGVKLVSSADGNSCKEKNSYFAYPSVADNKPASSSSSMGNPAVSSLFYRMVLMVLIVICLGIAGIYISKKLLPKLNLPGRRIQLAETIHLGPRKSLHLIRIGQKMLLIGCTNENITNLADVTDQLADFQQEDIGE